jgi:hypothetical protein
LPGAVPPISTSKVDPLAKLTKPVLRMPGLVPGAAVPPLFTVTEPFTVPVPASVPELLTVKALAAAVDPLTWRTP